MDTPRNFFIYGATMSGKSYLAERFPNPLFLNTDGNAAAGTSPAIQVRNVRDSTGRLQESIIDQIDKIVLALANEKHTYETVVIDVVDDICVMIEQAICLENNVQSLSDIPYGKGFSTFNQTLQGLVMALKALPLNVVYISRIATEGEGLQAHEVPSLKTKYYNIVNGNSDLVIETQRVGRNYIRKVTDRRKHYVRDQIEDEKILKILDNVNGVFDRPVKTTKEQQAEIVKATEKPVIEEKPAEPEK